MLVNKDYHNHWAGLSVKRNIGGFLGRKNLGAGGVIGSDRHTSFCSFQAMLQRNVDEKSCALTGLVTNWVIICHEF